MDFRESPPRRGAADATIKELQKLKKSLKVSPQLNVLSVITVIKTFEKKYIEALQTWRVRRFEILESQPTTKCNTYTDYKVDFSDISHRGATDAASTKGFEIFFGDI